MKKVLMLIDCQKDFTTKKGSLFVDGADEDMKRLADLIDKEGDEFSEIYLTLDSHHSFDIAHPCYWKDVNGNMPKPFTIIKSEDFESKWFCASGSVNCIEKTKYYLEKLEESGKYNLCIWPEHCIIGTVGREVDDAVFDAVSRWEKRNVKKAEYFVKGTNRYTEHYSAIKAEVVSSASPETMVNWRLIEKIDASMLYVGGEALSHCVASTLIDVAKYLGSDASRITLIEDCCSNVGGFERFGVEAVEKLSLMGMKSVNSKKLFV